MVFGGPQRQAAPFPQYSSNVVRNPRGPGPESMNFRPQRQPHPFFEHSQPIPSAPAQPERMNFEPQAPRQPPYEPPSNAPLQREEFPTPPRPQSAQVQQDWNQGGGSTHQELDPTYLEGCASLLDQIDKKVIVVLNDRRNIIGILRSCDQFSNLVLHQAVERIHVEKDYGDIPRGVFVIRGDNVVMVGEIDTEKEETTPLNRVSVERILDLQRQEQEARKAKHIKRSELARLRGAMGQDPDPDVDYEL